MKRTHFLLAVVLLNTCLMSLVTQAQEASDQTRYIIDKLYVSLRENADENSTVVASNLASGTQLALVEENKASGYSLVKMPNGTQGWLKTRYLQKTATASLRVASLEKQLAEALTKDKGDMQKELQAARDQLQAANDRAAKMEKELTEIKYASANIVKISAQNQELIQKNQLLQSKIDSLEAVSDQFQSNESMTFFIYGGLLVLATLILNAVIDGIKRKRSYGGGW